MRFLFLFILFIFGLSASFAQCNGSFELCDKRYDQVCYLTTHNAFNASDYDYDLPNQTHSLTRQLEEGVRGLMLDVYEKNGEVILYHGLELLGSKPLLPFLNEIDSWMRANPNEVATIFLQCSIPADLFEDDMRKSGLLDLVYTHDTAAGWPTLQAMIDSNERLVVLSGCDDADSTQSWYHYMWDLMTETPFSNHVPGDFDCSFLRGDPGNDLFMLNHFLTDADLGVGQIPESEFANEFNWFRNRVNKCRVLMRRFPNFLAVDFYELGDTRAVVNVTNGLDPTTSVHTPESEIFSIYPNPASDYIVVESANLQGQTWLLYDVHGKLLRSGRMIHWSERISIADLNRGVYLLRLDGVYRRLAKQ